MSTTERRKHIRQATLLRCRVEGAAAEALMWVTDLSAGGCYVTTKQTVPIGSRVTLHCEFGGMETVLTGSVVHSHVERGFAIEFSGLSDATRLRLDDFLQRIT
jgi:hypothetical protein